MEGVTEGRIVHFVMPDGQHRAAMIVRNWGQPDGSVNLDVYLDGTNDAHLAIGMSVATAAAPVGPGAPLIVWETSVKYDDTEKSPRTWHWIERA